MALVLDHVFVITSAGAPSADRLTRLGLTEGPANVHPGQGTANRRFFFDNAMLELLYVNDRVEAASGTGRGLGILARALDPTACPFGLVLRLSDDAATPPFPHWHYFPDYLPEDMSFFIGNNADRLQEPLCICMPPGLSKPRSTPNPAINSGWTLTGLTLQTPAHDWSDTLQAFAGIATVAIEPGDTHMMTLLINDGRDAQRADLHPDLPIVVAW